MELEKIFTQTDAKEIKSLLEVISISNKTVLTTKEIAKYLDVKTSTIDTWCSNRTITFYKLEGSNKRYFKRQEIDTWVTTYKIRSRKEVKSATA
ncbi:MAG: helix-turn-helix domain-containing protein [Flavobacteriaceae bacterium]|nr:helix-turn-helix domain-containing protein [Flavobacteriaceae bacterium]